LASGSFFSLSGNAPHCKLDHTHFAAPLNPAGESVAARFAMWSDPGSKLVTPQVSDWILQPAQTTLSLAAPLPDGKHLGLLATFKCENSIGLWGM
jgi:hypothetical protein